MAKKKPEPKTEPKTDGFNLSEWIRDHIGKNKDGSAKDAYAAILKTQPETKKNTFMSSFYSQQKKLAGGGAKTKRAKRTTRPTATNGVPSDEAWAFVRSAGSITNAIEQLEALK